MMKSCIPSTTLINKADATIRIFRSRRMFSELTFSQNALVRDLTALLVDYWSGRMSLKDVESVLFHVWGFTEDKSDVWWVF